LDRPILGTEEGYDELGKDFERFDEDGVESDGFCSQMSRRWSNLQRRFWPILLLLRFADCGTDWSFVGQILNGKRICTNVDFSESIKSSFPSYTAFVAVAAAATVISTSMLAFHAAHAVRFVLHSRRFPHSRSLEHHKRFSLVSPHPHFALTQRAFSAATALLCNLPQLTCQIIYTLILGTITPRVAISFLASLLSVVTHSLALCCFSFVATRKTPPSRPLATLRCVSICSCCLVSPAALILGLLIAVGTGLTNATVGKRVEASLFRTMLVADQPFVLDPSGQAVCNASVGHALANLTAPTTVVAWTEPMVVLRNERKVVLQWSGVDPVLGDEVFVRADFTAAKGPVFSDDIRSNVVFTGEWLPPPGSLSTLGLFGISGSALPPGTSCAPPPGSSSTPVMRQHVSEVLLRSEDAYWPGPHVVVPVLCQKPGGSLVPGEALDRSASSKTSYASCSSLLERDTRAAALPEWAYLRDFNGPDGPFWSGVSVFGDHSCDAWRDARLHRGVNTTCSASPGLWCDLGANSTSSGWTGSGRNTPLGGAVCLMLSFRVVEDVKCEPKG